MLPIGLCSQIACILEATARKPGNVHRYRDFEDAGYLDFLLSAAAVAPVLENGGQRPLGETILAAVRATQGVVATNTNLGIILLLAPLAMGPRINHLEGLRRNVASELERLDLEDARAVYQAIRLARPGGLGEVAEQDVAAEPTLPLREVMALAADRDLIALQYANGFREVFEEGVPALLRGLVECATLERAIIFCHLHLLAAYPDSLIQRKKGQAEAEEVCQRARMVLETDWPRSARGRTALADFDAWLRDPGHQRNPGTTADLVTACLFLALREGILQWPSRLPWSAGNDHA